MELWFLMGIGVFLILTSIQVWLKLKKEMKEDSKMQKSKIFFVRMSIVLMLFGSAILLFITIIAAIDIYT